MAPLDPLDYLVAGIFILPGVACLVCRMFRRPSREIRVRRTYATIRL